MSLGDSGLGLRYESNCNKAESWIMSVKGGSVSGHYPQTYVNSGSAVIPPAWPGVIPTILSITRTMLLLIMIVSIDLCGMTFK